MLVSFREVLEDPSKIEVINQDIDLLKACTKLLEAIAETLSELRHEMEGEEIIKNNKGIGVIITIAKNRFEAVGYSDGLHNKIMNKLKTDKFKLSIEKIRDGITSRNN